MQSVDIVTQADHDSLRIFELLFDLKKQRTAFKSLYISSFWSEKLILLLQGLQLFSLVYLANYDNWPTLWTAIVKSSIVNLLALDFASYSYDDLVDSSSGRILYTSLWLFLSYALLTAYFLFRVVLSLSVIFKVKFQRVAFAAAVILYLPTAIGLIPASICTYSGCWESAFPTVLLLLLTLVIFAVYLVGFPVYLAIHAHSHIITPDAESHEEFIQLRETEFVLQVSHNWLTDKYYLFSSYRLSQARVYNKPISLAVMLALVIIHSALGGYVATKMLIMCCVCCGFALYVTVLPAYRCMSSSWLQVCIWWIACFNAAMGYFRAYDYDSELLVDTNLTLFLSVINLIGLSLIGFVLLFSLLFCLKWPVHLATIKELALGYRYLLNDLRNAQRMILVLRSLRCYQFVKAQNIVEMMGLLREHYLLLYSERHALQYTVLEQMDVLSFLKDRVDRFSLLPCRRLEENFHELVQVIQRRSKEQIMISPLKRRLLLKMYLLKMFLGERTLQPVHFSKLDFDSDTSMSHKAFKQLDNDAGHTFSGYKSNSMQSSVSNFDAFISPHVKELARNGDYLGLAALTEKALAELNEPLLKELKAMWKELGVENLPEDLKTALFDRVWT
jgi:hypothetical protein